MKRFKDKVYITYYGVYYEGEYKGTGVDRYGTYHVYKTRKGDLIINKFDQNIFRQFETRDGAIIDLVMYFYHNVQVQGWTEKEFLNRRNRRLPYTWKICKAIAKRIVPEEFI